jgi:hypothetical protein
MVRACYISPYIFVCRFSPSLSFLTPTPPPTNKQTHRYEESCLHLACKRQGNDNERRVKVVTFLLKRDPDAISYADKNGMLPIHAALSHKSSCLGVVKLLLKNYPRGVSKRDNTGMLPLHHAVQSRVDVNVLELLVSAMPQACVLGDDSNRLVFSLMKPYQDEDKVTPSEHVVVRTIVDLFHDDDDDDDDDDDKMNVRKNAVRRMMRHEIFDRDVPRWTCVFRPLLKVFSEFASIEDMQGKFPLHYACEKHAPPCVIQDLIDLNDAIAMRRSRYGWLPLHYGITSHLETSSFRVVLESYTKSASQTDLKWKYTPFHMGLEAEVNDEVMCLLLKHAEEESKKHCHACAACALMLTRGEEGGVSVTKTIGRNVEEREKWIREAKIVANRVSVKRRRRRRRTQRSGDSK